MIAAKLILTFLFTLFIELGIYVVFIKKDIKQIFLYAVLINAFTQPFLNFIYHYAYHNLYVLEAAVFVIEAVLISLLFKIKFQRAALISFTANFITAFLALSLGYIW